MKIEMKIGENIRDIGEYDLAFDDGSRIQVATLCGANAKWLYSPTEISNALFDELKNCGFIYLDTEMTRKANDRRKDQKLNFYKFDVQKMAQSGYKVVDETEYENKLQQHCMRLDEARRMRKPGSNKQKELEFIKKYIANEDFGYEVGLKRLRSLWTAYCLHHDIECDTETYDSDLLEVWTELENNRSHPWCDDEDEGIVGFELFCVYIREGVA